MSPARAGDFASTVSRSGPQPTILMPELRQKSRVCCSQGGSCLPIPASIEQRRGFSFLRCDACGELVQGDCGQAILRTDAVGPPAAGDSGWRCSSRRQGGAYAEGGVAILPGEFVGFVVGPARFLL